jgi:hypothetical protein
MRSYAFCLLFAIASACRASQASPISTCVTDDDCNAGAVCMDLGDGVRCHAARHAAPDASIPESDAGTEDDAEADAAAGDPLAADPCAEDNGGCAPQVSCETSGKARSCGACPDGYTGDGIGHDGCVDVDECSAGSDDCSAPERCENQLGSFRCGECSDGFRPEGTDRCVARWTQLLGSSGDEYARGVAIDADDHVYVVGSTSGEMAGGHNHGSDDAFLIKYDSDGRWLWSVQLGTAGSEIATDVVVDSHGNVTLFGSTDGSFEGQSNRGGFDLFLARYTAKGKLSWLRQFGSDADDNSASAAIDGDDNLVATGFTEGDLDGHGSAGSSDLFVVIYDAEGEQRYLQQLGTTETDIGTGVAVDLQGNVLVTGETYGDMGSEENAGDVDLFVAKFDSDGEPQWTHQLGTFGADGASAIASVEGGNAYIAGFTSGALGSDEAAGQRDGFVLKYDGAGSEHWTRQLGTSSADSINAVAVDRWGSAYVTGVAGAGLAGESASHGLFVAKYDSAGLREWVRQVSALDSAIDIAIDSEDHAYVVGFTGGDLDGHESAGGSTDAFVVKFDDAGNRL